jgi:hypothetical protein
LLQSDLDELRNFQFFRGHFPYALFSDILFPEGFIGLTFLRDPVERTRSNYNFIHHLLKRDNLAELPQHADEFEQIKHLTLAGFLKRTDLKIYRELINSQTGFIGGSIKHSSMLPSFLLSFFPGKELELQARYRRLRSRVNGASGINENREVTRSHLNVARQRLRKIAFLGLVERFQDSLFLLSYTFGWRPILNTTHLNITPKKEEEEETTADVETTSMIRDMLKLDIELYQFGQDIFESRYNDMTNTLLRRYGKRSHAKLRSPLPDELMVEFLEQNYLDRRDCRAKKNAPPANEYLYQPGSKVEGPFGWHRPDFSPVHGRTCWSGPGVHSGFDLPCPSGTNIQISFRILMALKFEIIEQLSLTVNNIPVTLAYSVDSDGAFIFTGEIPPTAVSGLFLRLSFSVPLTIVPGTVDPDNRDPRQLGILLNWVKLQAF